MYQLGYDQKRGQTANQVPTNERYKPDINQANGIFDNTSDITNNIYESFNNKRSISTSPISFRIKTEYP